MGRTPSSLGVVQRRTLGAEVTRALRQAILTRRYRAGDHLTEADIAQQMGVSHGPVREALRELESEDLVAIEPHRGAFVKAFTARDIRDVYQFRTLLETAMVHLAMPRLRELDLEALESLVEAMRAANRSGDVDQMIELDLTFHRELCSLCDNSRMIGAWLRLASPIRLFLSIAVPRYLSLHDTAESHVPILEALRRRDPLAATRHMEHGVIHLGETIAADLEADEPADASLAEDSAS